MYDEIIRRSEQNKIKLKAAIQQSKVILFVGAGISATVGLPTWRQLITMMAHKLGYDENIFELYGDSLALAEYCEISGKMETIKEWMRSNWNVDESEIEKSDIFKSIVSLGHKRIYTTNYDCCLEIACKINKISYKPIITIDDFSTSNDETVEIIKLHGDISFKVPIVLTESSYYNRLNYDSPLDIRLKNDMLDNSFLFIGYSMSDINVRLMFHKLTQMWKDTSNDIRPDSFIFLPNPNPVQIAVLEKMGIYAIVGEYGDKSKDTRKFLNELR